MDLEDFQAAPCPNDLGLAEDVARGTRTVSGVLLVEIPVVPPRCCQGTSGWRRGVGERDRVQV